MLRQLFIRFAIPAGILLGTVAAMASNKILIVHDELPQMEVLSGILEKKGRFEVTLVEQSGMPEDWSEYRAVISYIHRDLTLPAEKAFIAYTENGGRFIALHHTISSKKATNEFFFDFLGIRLDNPSQSRNPVLPGGDYGWRDGVLTLVNVNPTHHITSHNVDWGEKITYTPSDQPAVEGHYPSLVLHESENYMNHKFTDGRVKTVLLGFKFLDDRNGELFMQDRAAWTKPYGKGQIVYLLPGHSVADFENRDFSQIIINAINWNP